MRTAPSSASIPSSCAAVEISAYLQEYCGVAGVGAPVYAYDTQREDCLWHVVHRGRKVLGLGFYAMDEQTLERVKAFVASKTLEA